VTQSAESQKSDVIDTGAVPLESILCTEELRRRPPRPPDYQKENGALLVLASALADTPRTLLQTLADTILEVCQSGSAGISLLTTRHSGSSTVEIEIAVDAEMVSLAVRDAGRGIPHRVMEQFRTSGNAGVGLAGMRARLVDLGGELRVQSDEKGTALQATIPLHEGTRRPPPTGVCCLARPPAWIAWQNSPDRGRTCCRLIVTIAETEVRTIYIGTARDPSRVALLTNLVYSPYSSDPSTQMND
jgi:hypothetical protein